ncbi:MAG: hypothetical protein FD149_420 [Rhodospirillaceae bacterium]|nr:MAG: hypothetical protein FD149_420 [Rhodospirillaceae bacterium]
MSVRQYQPLIRRPGRSAECAHIVVIAKGWLKPNRSTSWEYFLVGVGARRVTDWRPTETGPPLLMPRAALRDAVAKGEFVQLGAIATVTIAALRYGLDLFKDPLEDITARIAGITTPDRLLAAREDLVV